MYTINSIENVFSESTRMAYNTCQKEFITEHTAQNTASHNTMHLLLVQGDKYKTEELFMLISISLFDQTAKRHKCILPCVYTAQYV